MMPSSYFIVWSASNIAFMGNTDHQLFVKNISDANWLINLDFLSFSLGRFIRNLSKILTFFNSLQRSLKWFIRIVNKTIPAILQAYLAANIPSIFQVFPIFIVAIITNIWSVSKLNRNIKLLFYILCMLKLLFDFNQLLFHDCFAKWEVLAKKSVYLHCNIIDTRLIFLVEAKPLEVFKHLSYCICLLLDLALLLTNLSQKDLLALDNLLIKCNLFIDFFRTT